MIDILVEDIEEAKGYTYNGRIFETKGKAHEAQFTDMMRQILDDIYSLELVPDVSDFVQHFKNPMFRQIMIRQMGVIQ